MLEHVVLWKFADTAAGQTREENIARARAELLGLVGVVPQIREMWVSRDMAHTPASYDLMLRARFDSFADMEAYQVHPAHVAVANFVRGVVTSRVVLDTEEI